MTLAGENKLFYEDILIRYKALNKNISKSNTKGSNRNFNRNESPIVNMSKEKSFSSNFDLLLVSKIYNSNKVVSPVKANFSKCLNQNSSLKKFIPKKINSSLKLKNSDKLDQIKKSITNYNTKNSIVYNNTSNSNIGCDIVMQDTKNEGNKDLKYDEKKSSLIYNKQEENSNKVQTSTKKGYTILKDYLKNNDIKLAVIKTHTNYLNKQKFLNEYIKNRIPNKEHKESVLNNANLIKDKSRIKKSNIWNSTMIKKDNTPQFLNLQNSFCDMNSKIKQDVRVSTSPRKSKLITGTSISLNKLKKGNNLLLINFYLEKFRKGFFQQNKR